MRIDELTDLSSITISLDDSGEKWAKTVLSNYIANHPNEELDLDALVGFVQSKGLSPQRVSRASVPSVIKALEASKVPSKRSVRRRENAEAKLGELSWQFEDGRKAVISAGSKPIIWVSLYDNISMGNMASLEKIFHTPKERAVLTRKLIPLLVEIVTAHLKEHHPSEVAYHSMGVRSKLYRRIFSTAKFDGYTFSEENGTGTLRRNR